MNEFYLFIIYLKYYLFRYNIHDGDQFHVDMKPEPPKPQHITRTSKYLKKRNFKIVLFIYFN